jgi:hypothetical protein
MSRFASAICVLYLILIFGTTFGAKPSRIARSDAASPKILIKKKTDFWKVPNIFPFGLKSALNTDTGETLIVWQEAFVGTRGRILTPAGNSTTKQFSILVESYRCGVAYNPHTRSFLLVFKYGGSIAGVRLDSNARKIGQIFEIVPDTSTSGNDDPHVIFNPQTNGYALIWDKTEGIAAALLDQSGKLTGSIVILKKNPGPNGFYDYDTRFTFDGRIFDVALSPPGNKLMVVFQQRFTADPPNECCRLGGKADDWLATIDPLLRGVKPSNVVKINNKPIVLNSWGQWLASLAIPPLGSTAVFYADDTSVKQREINQHGKLLGISPAFIAPANNAPLHNPTVAFSTTSNGSVGLLIAHEWSLFGGTPTTAWARALDSKGRPVGNPVAVETLSLSGYIPMSSVLVALPRKPADKHFEFVWLQARAREDEGSILKLNLEVQP